MQYKTKRIRLQSEYESSRECGFNPEGALERVESLP